MADLHLPKFLRAPDIAVGANAAQEKRGDSEGLGPDLGIIGVEPPEIDVG
jgi:hypothetical protein